MNTNMPLSEGGEHPHWTFNLQFRSEMSEAYSEPWQIFPLKALS